MSCQIGGKRSEDADIIVLSSTAGAAKWMLAFSVSFLFFASFKLAGLCEGRPVYKKGSGSSAMFLLVQEGKSNWAIGPSTTNTSAGIVSGTATNSSSSTPVRLGVTNLIICPPGNHFCP